MAPFDRRTLLRRGAMAAGALAIADPLQAYAANVARGAQTRAEGYGPLRPAEGGELSLPEGFRYRVISREGQPMSDGNPTPGICDGMASFPGPDGGTILMRNHENRNPFFPGSQNEIPVVVDAGNRYDPNPVFVAGVTKLVVSADRQVTRDLAVLGGTTTNCAGGPTPWGSWITCEEFDIPPAPGVVGHGYIFEIDASTDGQVQAVPITSAGRFYHEAVAWMDGRLYQTEDFDIGNPQGTVAFYRYTPAQLPTKPGDLAASNSGTLEALKIAGRDNVDLRTGVTVGEPMAIEWVPISDPDPPAGPGISGAVRDQAVANGAAVFTRAEGAFVGSGRIYFDATNGGDAELGQVFELDPAGNTLTLVFESESPDILESPDNLVVAPTGDVFLCENGAPPPGDFVRGLTPEGQIFDFAQALTNMTEFAGACFSPDGGTLFLNQNGDRDGTPGVTYAIWGPFAERAGLPTGDPDTPAPDPGAPDRPDRRRNRGDDDRPRARRRREEDDRRTGGTRGGGDGGSGADGTGVDLPFTGYPLGAAALAGGLMAAGGALIRRRMANREEVEEGAGDEDDAPGDAPRP